MFPICFPSLPLVHPLAKLTNDYDLPPTIYALLNSYLNYDKEAEDKTKIKNLARAGRAMFFDFDYPLTDKIDKEDFEALILNHFLMRRIGYETVTAFKIALEVKLNEVMPYYNKLFAALDGWDILNDGYTMTRKTTTANSSETSDEISVSTTSNNSATDSTESSEDLRSSDTPQNQLTDVKSGDYVDNYSYNERKNDLTSSANSSGTSTTSGTNTGESNSDTDETITKTAENKMAIYTEFLNNRQKIYTLLFKDLEPLFFSVTSL